MLNLNKKSYRHNQYYMSEGQEKVKAIYIDPTEPSYKENLLINALPPRKTAEQVSEDFTNNIRYSEDERNMNVIDRKHAIYRLQDFMLPLENNFLVDDLLDSVIKEGYVSRKIVPKELMNNFEQSSKLISGSKEEIQNFVLQTSSSTKPSLGFMIFGRSGQGKSTSVDICLNSIPQVIVHELDESKFTQITWLKIDCGHDRGLKGICLRFFRSIDGLLGTSYEDKYNRLSAERMIIAMSNLSKQYSIGALIIDELQNLSTRQRSVVNSESTANFFCNLMNEIDLPIVNIGTYKAFDSNIGRAFIKGRRPIGASDVEFGVTENKKMFNLFLDELWKFQWTSEESVLTDEIRDIFYNRTAGITADIIELYMAVQLEVVKNSKQEKITPKIIKDVVEKNLSLAYMRYYQ